MSMELIEATAAFMSSLIGIGIGIAGAAGELISIGATALASGRGDGCRLLAGGVGEAGPLVIPGVGPIVISGIGDELEGGGAKAARALPEKRAVAAAIVTKASGKRSNRTAAFRSIYYG
jgi:hypothetical protein